MKGDHPQLDEWADVDVDDFVDWYVADLAESFGGVLVKPPAAFEYETAIGSEALERSEPISGARGMGAGDLPGA